MADRDFYCCGQGPVGWCSTNCIPFGRCARPALTEGDDKEKAEINRRVQERYDQLMRAGKHGHYETLFQIVHEERKAAYDQGRQDLMDDRFTIER